MVAAVLLPLLRLLAHQKAPTLAEGTSPEFAKTALAVEAKLVEGDVAGAREAAKAPPVRQPRLVWTDDANLPPELREARDAAVARVAGAWARRAKGFALQEGPGAPDVTLGFADVLPEGPDGLPLQTSVQPGPPFRATIGLHRGKPAEPLRREEMTAEIAYALGRYLGVPETPFQGSAMHRDGRPMLNQFMPQSGDELVAGLNLDLADRLRAGIEAGKPIGLTTPAIRLSAKTVDFGEVPQGQPIRAYVDVENVGAGPLDFHIVPECSCFSSFRPETVPPQGRVRVPITINTIEYIGRQEKRILLLSNDPAQPQIEILNVFRSRPGYRLFRPGGPDVVVPDGGGAYDVFLFPDPKNPFRPVAAHWDGIDGSVKMAPWSGTLVDEEMKEGPMPRTGWRFRVRIAPNLDAGTQSPGTLRIETDSPRFGTLMYAMNAQKGAVTLPERLSLGDLVPGSHAAFVVVRPNAPFKITSVEAGPFKATWRDRKGGWDYQVDLEFKGDGSKGDLLVPIRIHTDDPKQPLIESVVSGIAR